MRNLKFYYDYKDEELNDDQREDTLTNWLCAQYVEETDGHQGLSHDDYVLSHSRETGIGNPEILPDEYDSIDDINDIYWGLDLTDEFKKQKMIEFKELLAQQGLKWTIDGQTYYVFCPDYELDDIDWFKGTKYEDKL